MKTRIAVSFAIFLIVLSAYLLTAPGRIDSIDGMLPI